MILHIYDYVSLLFEIFFSGLGQIINFAGSAVSFLLKAAASVFSVLSKIISIPYQLGTGAADFFGLPALWAPLFLLGAVILILAALTLTGLVLLRLKQRR